MSNNRQARQGVRRYIDAQNATQKEEAVSGIIEMIDTSRFTIDTMLAELKEYIDAELDEEHGSLVRSAETMELLCDVLTNMKTKLTLQQNNELTRYFVSRVQAATAEGGFGRTGLLHVANALRALLGMSSSVVKDNGVAISDAVSKLARSSLYVQLPPTTRLAFLQLMHQLFHLQQDPTSTLWKDKRLDICDRVVLMAELEHNPRCLTEIFEFYYQLAEDRFSLLEENNLKGIFDSFVRYYPIDITGPMRDSSAPSPHELASRLGPCFLAHTLLSRWGTEMLLEKLENSEDITVANKIRLVETLTNCIANIPFDFATTIYKRMWEVLKSQIWNSDDDNLINWALNVLRGLTQVLLPSWNEAHDEHGSITAFLALVLAKCTKALEDENFQVIMKSGKILGAVMISPDIFSMIAPEILDTVQHSWSTSLSINDQEAFQSVVNNILKAYVEIPTLREDIEDEDTVWDTTDMLKHLEKRQKLIVDEMYFHPFNNPSIDPTSLRTMLEGISYLLCMPETFVSEYENGAMLGDLNKRLFTPGQAEIRDAVVSALRKISIEDPLQFQRITLMHFMAALPSEANGGMELVHQIAQRLGAICEVSCLELCKKEFKSGPPDPLTNYKHRLFEAVQTALLEKLTQVLRIGGQLYYGQLILSTMHKGLEMFNEALETSIKEGTYEYLTNARNPYEFLIKGLWALTLEPKKLQGTRKGWYVGINAAWVDSPDEIDSVVEWVGRITTLALRSKVTTYSRNFLIDKKTLIPGQKSHFWTLSCDPRIKGFQMADLHNPATTDEKLLDAPSDFSSSVIVSMSAIAGLSKENMTDETQAYFGDDTFELPVDTIALNLLKYALRSTSTIAARMAAIHLTQLLINKFGAARNQTIFDAKNFAEPTPDTRKRGDKDRLFRYIKYYFETDAYKSKEEPENSFRVLAYVTAAFLFTMEAKTTELLRLMERLIQVPNFGHMVAQTYHLLIAPSSILCAENHCTLRPLRIAKLYEQGIKPLIALYRFSCTAHAFDRDTDLETNYLTAISRTLSYIPITAFFQDISQIVPLLLTAADLLFVFSDDGTVSTTNVNAVHLSSLSTLDELLSSSSEIIQEHLDSFMRILTFKVEGQLSSVDVRCQALEILAAIASVLSGRELVRRQGVVERVLDGALGHENRTVRASAQRARGLWFGLENDGAKEGGFMG